MSAYWALTPWCGGLALAVDAIFDRADKARYQGRVLTVPFEGHHRAGWTAVPCTPRSPARS